MKAITNRSLRKYRTMEKITYRHLKRCLDRIKSLKEEEHIQVIIVHDRIPLFFNVDKRDFNLHPWIYDMVDSAFCVDGKMKEASSIAEVSFPNFFREDKNFK